MFYRLPRLSWACHWLAITTWSRENRISQEFTNSTNEERNPVPGISWILQEYSQKIKWSDSEQLAKIIWNRERMFSRDLGRTKRSPILVWAREFILKTDYQPLTYLKKSETENFRLMIRAIQLQQNSIAVIKGSKNEGTDYLSRQWLITIDKIRYVHWSISKYVQNFCFC